MELEKIASCSLIHPWEIQGGFIPMHMRITLHFTRLKM
jgi:hypothetical protein